jgi:hypothetical protein
MRERIGRAAETPPSSGGDVAASLSGRCDYGSVQERDPIFRWVAAHPVWTGVITLVIVLGFVSQFIAFALAGAGATEPRPASSRPMRAP